MAIADLDPYVTLDELKAYLSITTSQWDDQLSDALDSASREIEKYTNRQFNQDTVASPRIYDAEGPRYCDVDDFWTADSLVVQTGATYEITWDPTDYELFPRNGITDGQPGWAFNQLRTAPLGNHWFGITGYQRWSGPNDIGNRYLMGYHRVQVTAQWGWAAVPSPVKQACKIMAGATFQVKDAPFGVAGSDVWGTIRVKDNLMAMSKLDRYVREPVLVG
jgi:hypothetical protein